METNENLDSEKVFFEDKTVYISQSRFVSKGKTYAMRNISSVTNLRTPKNISGGIFIIFIGLISMLFGGSGIAIGTTLLILGILIIAVKKDQYSVMISSNSGESKALVSESRDYVQSIVDALNNAIIYRG